MPVHVEEMTSEVAVFEGDLPLTQAQIDKLVQLVVRCLEQKQRAEKWGNQATELRRGVSPQLKIGG
jgi:hypothetical protein